MTRVRKETYRTQKDEENVMRFGESIGSEETPLGHERMTR